MPAQVKIRDLRSLVNLIDRQSRKLGLITAQQETIFEKPSFANGHAYRLYLEEKPVIGLQEHPATNYKSHLGMTRSEAYQALHRILDALDMISDDRKRMKSLNEKE